MKRLCFILLVWCSGIACAFGQRVKTDWYDRLPVKENGKWGYINSSGYLIIPATFDNAMPFNWRAPIAQVMTEGHKAIINSKGKIIANGAYDDFAILSPEQILIRKGSKWGVLNLEGDTILPATYDTLQSIACDYILNINNGRETLISPAGKLIISKPYQFFFILNNCNAVMASNKKETSIYNLNGELLIERIEDSRHLDSMLLVKKRNKWGVINGKGELASQNFWADTFRAISPSVILFTRADTDYLFSARLKKVISDTSQTDFESFNYGSFFKFTKNEKVGLMSPSGAIVLSPTYDDLVYVNSKTLAFASNDYYGLMNYKGKVIVPAKYDEISPYDTDYLTIKLNYNAGLMDKKGNEILAPKYYEVSRKGNIIKGRGARKTKVLEIDANGKIVDDVSYGKVMHVSVNGRRRFVGKGFLGSSGIADDTISRGWKYLKSDTGNSYYTLYDDKGKVLIPPTYTSRTWLMSIGLSQVGLPVQNLLPLTGNPDLQYNQLYGLLSDNSLKMIIKPQYLSIQTIPSADNAYNNFKAIVYCKDGKYRIINQNEDTILNNLAYTGYLSSNRMRFAIGKGLVVGTSFNGRRVSTFDGFLSSIGQFGNEELEDYNVYCDSCQWGYLDEKGNISISAQYDFVEEFSEDHAFAVKNGLWGMIDKKGKTIIPFLYASIGNMENSQSWIKVGLAKKKYAYASPNGQIYPDSSLEWAGKFQNGLAWIRSRGAYYVIDTNMRIVSTAKDFISVHNFSEGLAAVLYNKTWHYVNGNGESAINEVYVEAKDFNNGLAAVKNNKRKYGYIDISGNWVIEAKYLDAGHFNKQGQAIVKTATGYALINRLGAAINKTNYKKMTQLGDGIIYAGNDYQSFLIDSEAKVYKLPPGTLSVRPFSEGFAIYRTNSGQGAIDHKGNIVTKVIYDSITDFKRGMALSYNKRKKQYTLLNKQGKVLYTFGDGVSQLFPFSEGLSTALPGKKAIRPMSNNKRYFIDTLGREMHSFPEIQNARPFTNGKAWVRDKEGWGLINKDGVYIICPYLSSVPVPYEKTSVVAVNDYTGIMTVRGKTVLKPGYDNVSFIDHCNYFMIIKGNKIGYMNNVGKWVWPLSE